MIRVFRFRMVNYLLIRNWWDQTMRQPGNKKPKEKGTFISTGPNWVMSLDGHDKFMGFQNNTFPIAIYGASDTGWRLSFWWLYVNFKQISHLCSSVSIVNFEQVIADWILLLSKVRVASRMPELVARWYFEFIYEKKVMPNYILTKAR